MIETLAFVLAGGKGERLMPITRYRAKPAVLFGPHAIIDFPLANLHNSGIRQVRVMAQYRAESLEGHIRHVWAPQFDATKGESLKVLRPQAGINWAGTASPVAGNLEEIMQLSHSVVNVICGDHVYIMDYGQMNGSHAAAGADLTISAVPIRQELAARNYGVLVVDNSGWLIGFEEKPANPTPMPGNPGYCLASMGNYAFSPAALLHALAVDAAKATVPRAEVVLDPAHFSTHDFGYDIIPHMLKNGMRIQVYNFLKNTAPGRDALGWCDVGNPDALHYAAMAALSSGALSNPAWRIPVNGIGHPDAVDPLEGKRKNVVVPRGCVLDSEAVAEDCLLGYAVRMENGSRASRCLVQGNNRIGSGAELYNAIVCEGVDVPPGARVGSTGRVTVVTHDYFFTGPMPAPLGR